MCEVTHAQRYNVNTCLAGWLIPKIRYTREALIEPKAFIRHSCTVFHVQFQETSDSEPKALSSNTPEAPERSQRSWPPPPRRRGGEKRPRSEGPGTLPGGR